MNPPVSLDPALSGEQPIVARLLQLYLHDFSGFATADDPYGRIGEDGLFAYPFLESYWQNDPARRAYLFRVSGDLAGFALVNDWAPSGHPVDNAIAEFFILRKYRRSGLGRTAAAALFSALPGTWELGVAGYNGPALLFWRSALTSLPVRDLREFAGDGTRWTGTVFRFAV